MDLINQHNLQSMGGGSTVSASSVAASPSAAIATGGTDSSAGDSLWPFMSTRAACAALSVPLFALHLREHQYCR